MKRKENKKNSGLPYPLPRKIYALLGLGGFLIAFISALHGLNEAWAWKVAESLITLNGLVLGFSVLAATIFSRGSFTQSAYEKMIKESITRIEAMKESKEKEKSETVKEKLQLFVQPIVRMRLLHEVFWISSGFLLFSVGSAICLFGVNDTMIGITSFELLFFLLYANAISCFLIGTFFTFFGAYHVLELSQRTFGEMLELYEKEFEKRKKQKEEKPATSSSK